MCLEDQAKAWSPTDQLVRKCKDRLGIIDYENLLDFNISHHVRSIEWRLRRVVPAAAVTARAKPHAQQQLARDLEVERAAMGQRCRPQNFREVQRGNPQPRRWLDFLSTA